jgi:hypothetical protein
MNHYKHALYKEIAAQMAGYEPSHVWGRIANPHDKPSRESNKMFSIYMNSQHPTHMPGSPFLNMVKGSADKFINNLPKDGIIKPAAFNKHLH